MERAVHILETNKNDSVQDDLKCVFDYCDTLMSGAFKDETLGVLDLAIGWLLEMQAQNLILDEDMDYKNAMKAWVDYSNEHTDPPPDSLV